ncbi:embryo defective 1923 [Raphanus sativus]|nr:embryo defective 1923 [Raphanus sativus]
MAAIFFKFCTKLPSSSPRLYELSACFKIVSPLCPVFLNLMELNKLTSAPPQFLNAGASLRGEFPTVRLRVSTRCERENAHNGERSSRDSPIRWPWFLALAFLVYAWRAVLFELSNWRNAVFSIVTLLRDLSNFALAFVFHFIGDPITCVIALVETAIYSVRGFYSGIVAYTPVRELTTVILLASSVLAIGETVAPNSISKQPYLVTLAGLLGYAAVHSYISEPFFWTVLVGLYGYSRLVKKRDHVTSALPCAAVLAGVGEPWVRVVVIAGFLALAMRHNSTKTSSSADEEDRQRLGKAPPVPLLAVALAIGVRLAAKWAGYRHLTWMIV